MPIFNVLFTVSKMFSFSFFCSIGRETNGKAFDYCKRELQFKKWIEKHRYRVIENLRRDAAADFVLL